ncbi:MAG: hypothetical protein ACPLW8_05570 [Candidatus Bathyarchaeales archaeon]
MPSLLIEAKCKVHGVERYRIKIIKKCNIDPDAIQPKFRTKPTYGLSGIIIGRNVPYKEVKEYLLENIDKLGLSYVNILSIKMQT